MLKRGLVIGMGPSMFELEHLPYLANHPDKDLTLLVSDRALKPCLWAGVTPKKFPNFYVFSIEELTIVGEYMIAYKDAHLIKLVYSERSRMSAIETARRRKYVLEPFLWDWLKVTPNVGLMGFCYGWKELGLKEIGIIGMDLGGEKKAVPLLPGFDDLYYEKILNPHTGKVTVLVKATHGIWRETFLDFLQLCPKDVKIVNCTGGGCLFDKRIEWSNFKKWLA